MNIKRAYKIGVSLLIMLAFILPTGSILADRGNSEAGDYELIDREFKKPNAPISQDPGDITSMGIMMESPEGDEYYYPTPDGVLPIDDYYTLYVGTNTEPGMQGIPCPEIQAGASLYEVTRGVEVPMYETSFEDNYDIYLNWVQVDEDCSAGGYYDSWSWSDARSTDGDHSMKSTMYDEYKQSQDDYLEMRNCYDISDQYSVVFEFDIWVEGDWEDDPYGYGYMFRFFDYVDFEVWDGDWYDITDILQINWAGWGLFQFADTSIPLYFPRGGIELSNTDSTGGYHPDGIFDDDETPMFEELGDNWWHVTFEIDTGWFWFPECVKARFSWHTDAQFEHEGAYVDNFKMISIEGVEEKIWQTHFQECTEIACEGCDYTAFPLVWEDVVPGDYYWLVWVETENCPTAEFYNSSFPKPGYIYPFTVGDNIDCNISDLWVEDSFTHELILNDGRMTAGADAHVVFNFTNSGNIPMENIPIKFTVFKEAWQELISYDAETGMGLSDSYFAGLTDFDSYTGSKSIYFGNEDYMQYEPDHFGYVELAGSIDFSAHKRVQMDYYWKGLTNDALTFFAPWGIPVHNDGCMPTLFDNYQNNVLGSGIHWNPANPNSRLMTGFQPDWIGPNNPAGKYQPVDLLYQFNRYAGIGYFRDYSGNLDYDVTVGFTFIDNFAAPDGIEYNPYAHDVADPPYLWSGVFVDDIVITALSATDEVFTDSMIIPGPVAPDETQTYQFEWEDVPFSYYKMCVEAECEGDIDLSNNERCQQIIVTDDLERIDKPEAFDNYQNCEGGWGICTGAPEWQVSTNPDGLLYDTDQISVLEFTGTCLNGQGDIEFDGWWECEGYPYDWLTIEIAPGTCEPDDIYDWQWLADIEGFSDFWPTFALAYGPVTLTPIGDVDDDFDGWYHVEIDNSGIVAADEDYTIRFIFYTDGGWNFRGFIMDNFFAPGMENFDAGYGVGMPDQFEDLDNFEVSCMTHGSFWSTDALPYCLDLQSLTGFSQSLVWATEIEDAYEAWLAVNLTYDLGSAEAKLEISGDGGSIWYHMDTYTGTATNELHNYDISFLAGNELLVKFTVEGAGTGQFCINDAWITGKQDITAPTSSASMSGTMKESGWYTTNVAVTISATDEGAGMGEIHYILDGVETVVAGDSASFTVSGNGEHNIEYWAEDAMGNEEIHHIIPSFRIDSGSPPSVAITAPEPGLYLFGNKLLSASKVIIIGAFTVEATASDAESGIYRVQFFLDGDLVSEDTEVPFSAYVAEKHMGAGTIKVVAEDYAQNTAEDTLDITYYKFL